MKANLIGDLDVQDKFVDPEAFLVVGKLRVSVQC